MSKIVNGLDTIISVQEWQKNHHHDGSSKPEDRSVAARLCDGVLDVFHEAICQLEQPRHAETTPKPVRISLERARGLIALWSDGYGIQDGRLDDVLAKSRNIRRSTLKTLSNIANTLLSRLIPLAQISSDKLGILAAQLTAAVDEASYMIHDAIHDGRDDRSDTSSDDFSDVGPDDSIAEVAEDLKTDAQCLMELDPLFRDPVLDLASQKQKQHLEAIDWTPETAFCDKVQQRFPKAEPTLVERLGKANWARFLRCQEIRNSVEMGTLSQTNTAGNQGEDGTVAASSRFHDSGLGTSLATASLYAETVMTYGAAAGQKVRIPPLSDEAKNGAPFPCLACGRSVRITNNSGWKRHLYLDLEPYLCLEPQCFEHCRFSTRIDWVAHLALDHCYQPGWDAITCPLCFETTEKGKLAVTTHLAQHLEEISLSALPAYPDEDDDDAFETGSDESTEEALEEAAGNARLDGDKGLSFVDDEEALRERETFEEAVRRARLDQALEDVVEEIDRKARLNPEEVVDPIKVLGEIARKARLDSHDRTEAIIDVLEEINRKARLNPEEVVDLIRVIFGERARKVRLDYDGTEAIREVLGERARKARLDNDDVAETNREALEEEDREACRDDDEEEANRDALEEMDRKARLDDDDVTETIRDALEKADREARRDDEAEALKEALDETDSEVGLHDLVVEERASMREAVYGPGFDERSHNEDQRPQYAWERRRDEELARQESYVGMSEDEIRQEMTVDDHLHRLQAEADYRTSDEDDDDDDEGETVVEDWDSRK